MGLPFEMVKTEHETIEAYHKANRESGYSFKNTYCEIKEQNYWYMLEVLPPARLEGSIFLMCERNKGNLVNGAVMFGDSLRKKETDKYYIFTISFLDWCKAKEWIYKNLGGKHGRYTGFKLWNRGLETGKN